jgi:hypothetical protein
MVTKSKKYNWKDRKSHFKKIKFAKEMAEFRRKLYLEMNNVEIPILYPLSSLGDAHPN